ncbi:hypothetical protein [Streptomyces platensis]|uniref:hypothetical protein n=1 Tax=Streptomyces platensis TaxID=58346 RepID=UPI00332D2B5A
MDFSVEPGNLSGYGKLIGRAADDMRAAVKHLKYAEVDESFPGDLWQKALGEHEPQVAKAREALNGFARILDSSSAELERSAKYYRSTDREQAAKVDATYPRGEGQPAYSEDYSGDPGDFRDRSNAGSHLKAPEPEPSFLDHLKVWNNVADYFPGHAEEFQYNPAIKTFGTGLDVASPSAWVNEGIKLVFGWDILGDFSQWVAGDWQSYIECAGIWDNLAKLCGAVSDNVSHGNYVLEATWNGNAADTAYDYFDSLAEKLSGAKESFETLRDGYIQMSTGVFGFAETVKAGMADICDWALEIGIAAAAAWAETATGVGAIAAIANLALMADRARRMFETYEKLLDAYGLAMKGITLLFSVGGTSMAKTGDEVKAFPVVGHGYDNPAA